LLTHSHAFLPPLAFLFLAVAFYKPGAGIGTLSLTFLGFGAVMTNLSIPLLWIQIASSGMNKGEAATRKAKAEKFVKVMSGIFIFTFVGVAFAAGMGTTGLYSILWLLGFLAAFNVGGRKIRTQLTANDKEGRNTEAVNSIMMYVRSYTFGLFLYIVSIMWFLSASGASEDPHGWWLPALLIYVSLNLLVNFNLRYLYASLKKKLNKGKRGAVADSSTASSSASTNSSSTE
jgi:hypothetical protein